MGYRVDEELDEQKTDPQQGAINLCLWAGARKSWYVCYADENDYLARLLKRCRQQQQILVGTTMMPSTRRSKRPQPTESLEEVPATKPKKAYSFHLEYL